MKLTEVLSEKLDDWSWEDTWGTILAGLVSSIIVFLFIYAFSTKTLDYYYIQHSDNQTCVQTHWTWNTDVPAFCTDDYNRALDFVTRANATLKR